VLRASVSGTWITVRQVPFVINLEWRCPHVVEKAKYAATASHVMMK
jgi:hypothetical protein